MNDAPIDTHAAEARLVAEISERLLEWIELSSRPRVIVWLRLMGVLAEHGGSALPPYLRSQTGDISWMGTPFAEQAESEMLTKQALHKRVTDMHARLDIAAPALSGALRDLRASYCGKDAKRSTHTDDAHFLASQGNGMRVERRGNHRY